MRHALGFEGKDLLVRKKAEFRNPFFIDPLDYDWRIKWYKKVYDRSSNRIAEGVHKRGSYAHGPKRMFFEFLWSHGPESTSHFFINAEGKDPVKIKFNPKNTQFHALYLNRYGHGYEPEITNFIDVMMGERGVFYDVGSNWGYYALFTASMPASNHIIHAFEPSKNSFSDLRSVVKQSGYKDIYCHDFALSDDNKSGYLEIKSNSGENEVKEGKSRSTEGIELRRLDDLDIALPDIMKIDVEKHELEVIKGGEKTITNALPHIIFENEISLPSLIDGKPINERLSEYHILKEIGYRFFHPGWIVDGVFIPSNHALFIQGDKYLALKEINYHERYIYRDKFNCIACHENRIGELEGKFND